MQTDGKLNRKFQVIYAGAYDVAHYHPLILPWKNIICVIEENNTFITLGGKEKMVFMVQVKKQLTRPCFRLGQQFKSMFSFWTFSGWILNHLGVVHKSCGAPVTGWFSHLGSQRDMGNMFMFKRPTKFQKPGYRVNRWPSRGPPRAAAPAKRWTARLAAAQECLSAEEGGQGLDFNQQWYVL